MGKKKKVKALPRKRPVHRVNVTYTMEERSKILVKMTPEQQEAYTASIQLTFSDRVMNTVFEEAPHWKFVGIQVDYGWEYRKTHPEKSANLKCVCGRQLRYQYQLISTDGRHRRINLGSSHFMQHLGIPVRVSREVFADFNQVQRKMDEMLWLYGRGRRFPSKKGKRDLVLSDEFKQLNSVVARRIRLFAVADLPLTEKDTAKLGEILHGLKAGVDLERIDRRTDQGKANREVKLQPVTLHKWQGEPVSPSTGSQSAVKKRKKRQSEVKTTRVRKSRVKESRTDSDSRVLNATERRAFYEKHEARKNELIKLIAQARKEMEQSPFNSPEHRAARNRYNKYQSQRNDLNYKAPTQSTKNSPYPSWMWDR